ncbi:leucine-rich repeat protein 1-like [Stylophora pistillata]|nr:leucine-rich repeat protein 1-like [Stylophora pistillata]
MRLNCEISIVNRIATSHNVRNTSKPARASLAIGRKDSSKLVDEKGKNVFLLVCTAKERNGTKYKIKENLQQVFTKFLEKGKATIRFKEPPHDLFINKADPSSLKTFLSILKLGDKALENVNLSCLVPAKVSEIEKPKTEMVIKHRADYPLGKPFPSKLKKLTVNNCGLVRIEARILQMKSLSCLNVADNQVRAIPCRLVSFSALSELILGGNRIREFPPLLCSGSLASSLKLLDLSQNEIKLLPVTFCNLKNLVHLKIDQNKLLMLPINTGNLSNLRFLSTSHNQLRVLPYSLSKLNLDSIDVSENPFLAQDKWHNISKLTVPSVKECAGIAVKKHKCVYYKDLIPSSLCVFLDTAKQCFCGNYCFTSCVHHITTINIHQLAHTVVSACPTQSHIPAESFICSQRCLQRMQSSKRPSWR